MSKRPLKYLPIDEMHVSKLNMRHGRKAPEIDDIYPSVLKSGVLKPMLVRREGESWGVVAGRRRLFALKRKQKETQTLQEAPCVIMQPDDDAAALEASIIENVGVETPSEMQQYEAFASLAKKGRGAPEIADYFGVDERDVKRILALGGLAPGIRKLYAADEIDASTIRALTLGSKAQQEEWLRLWQGENERAPMGRQCRAWIAGGAAITTDKALFDLADYKGEIASDLFGDFGVFASADAFWEAQSRAISERLDACREKGWRDVTIMERGAFFHSWDYEKRPRTKGGRVFVEIRHDGSVTFHEGYVTGAEARKLNGADTGESSGPAPIRPEMSAPVAEYVALHRHAAARAELVASPGVALRLMIAHALAGSPLWQLRPHQCRTGKEATRESVETGAAAASVEERRVAVADLFSEYGLAFEGVDPNGDDWRLCAFFAALMKMTGDEVESVAAIVMAETLDAGSAAVEAALHVTGAKLGDWWKPDEAFFDLLRDKRAINAMVCHIAGETAAKAVLTDTANAQKAVIRDRLKLSDDEAQSAWLPAWMQTPPRRLIDGAGSPPADQWDRIASLFEASDAPAPAKEAA
ncbi:ParB/RepB/Spo0J family partition protein [Hyphococcus luteus]|uniref:Partitioning protein n=1 Tax=Hyphococcus luteus TaxID=2058213 RepID=A0A2S7K511_9PROT|nr:ParB/RepB/Spo0J family partition protein [Marinicaulis flavus]PQA87582.1 partitioning protein [Marinicaulis flavus]